MQAGGVAVACKPQAPRRSKSPPATRFGWPGP